MGIHVSRGPKTAIFQSNGRVINYVHLRIHCFDLNIDLFDTVLTLFGPVWHCLAIWDPENA